MLTDGRTDGRTNERTNGRKLARLCLPAKAGATKSGRRNGTAVIFFTEKLYGAFELQKFLTSFRQKRIVFLHIIHLKFNIL